jgi:hypothetical protein
MEAGVLAVGVGVTLHENQDKFARKVGFSK